MDSPPPNLLLPFLINNLKSINLPNHVGINIKLLTNHIGRKPYYIWYNVEIIIVVCGTNNITTYF